MLSRSVNKTQVANLFYHLPLKLLLTSSLLCTDTDSFTKEYTISVTEMTKMVMYETYCIMINHLNYKLLLSNPATLKV